VDIVLVDWTRMGKNYCLAGVVQQDGQLRVVRPLPIAHQSAPVRNVGWSPILADGHSRWEIFELLDPKPAEPSPPHLEDVWVRGMKSRNRLAEASLRRAILRATQPQPGEPWFGTALTLTRSSVYVAPRDGLRSLVSLVVPARAIRFTVSWREGAPEPDCRVSVSVPELQARSLPLKDHFLLRRAELASSAVEGRTKALTLALAQMGEEVVVRLGLSRGFQAAPGRAENACWLMADGLFSLNDPQC
jgi:hypothetical protein